MIAFAAGAFTRRAGRDQSESTRLARWVAQYEVLVRDPMSTKISAACAEVEAIAATLLNPQEQLHPEMVVADACSRGQDVLLRLRTDLAMLALAADEHELNDRLLRALGIAEEQILAKFATSITERPDRHGLRRELHGQFARLQRGLVQHGKDARLRLRVPLKPKG
jgi:hypothetical protein